VTYGGAVKGGVTYGGIDELKLQLERRKTVMP